MQHIDAMAGPHVVLNPEFIPKPEFIHSRGPVAVVVAFGVGDEALNGGVNTGRTRRPAGSRKQEGTAMFETPITIVGNIITAPDRRWVGDQELIKFRVASNSRRRTAEGTWEPGNSLYATVNCWGNLITGVGAGLGKGDPVIVVGNVYTNEYEDRDGNRRSSLEIRATSVGPDLARCIVRMESRRHSRPAVTEPRDEADGRDTADAEDAEDAVETPSAERDDEALSLSA